MPDHAALPGAQPHDPADDPFAASMLARPAALRVVVVAVALVPLWAAIAWAMAVP